MGLRELFYVSYAVNSFSIGDFLHPSQVTCEIRGIELRFQNRRDTGLSPQYPHPTVLGQTSVPTGGYHRLFPKRKSGRAVKLTTLSTADNDNAWNIPALNKNEPHIYEKTKRKQLHVL
jgi:hypothetical protein